MTIRKLSALAVITAIAGVQSASAEPADSGRAYLSPRVGVMSFDGDRNFDNSALYQLGLGYQLSPKWDLEAVYGQSDVDADGMAPDVDIENLLIEGLYKFDKQGDWTPYLAVGAGHQELEPDGGDNDKTTLAQLGWGLKYAITDNLEARGDMRWLHTFDGANANDSLISLGLNWVFGQKAQATPLVVAAPVAAAPKDSDKDGVVDGADACPSTPLGAKVDEQGCRIKLMETVRFELNINFATNSDAITSSEEADLSALAQFLTSYPDTQVTIEGHTDSMGDASYNQDLSERRAASARNFIIDNYQIDPTRIGAKGFGESQPIADNSTAEGRRANRRVVAEVATKVEKLQ